MLACSAFSLFGDNAAEISLCALLEQNRAKALERNFSKKKRFAVFPYSVSFSLNVKEKLLKGIINMIVKRNPFREIAAYLLMYAIGFFPFAIALILSLFEPLTPLSRYFFNSYAPALLFWWSAGVLNLVAIRSKLFGLILGAVSLISVSATTIPNYLILSNLALADVFSIRILEPLLPTLSAVLAIIVFFSTQNKKLAFFGPFFTIVLIHFLMNLQGDPLACLLLLIPYGFGLLPYFLEQPFKKLLKCPSGSSDECIENVAEKI